MIQRLDHTKKAVAQRILHVQQPAYEIEEVRIGFKGIPALRDTVKDIQTSHEQFFGYIVEETLAGMLAYECCNRTTWNISRLVVHPDFFRRGIAKALLRYTIEACPPEYALTVSTALANTPAVHLYEKHRFYRKRYDVVRAGLMMVTFEHDGDSNK
ncbi:GNAT family N-acetyltransferase [Bacillaceae bacterium SIJ1]|uniref:GNAT family N-acetyltransferase n=1 Tax=Litoribacterium kuwaitense TaxID=1398745 RepID=UPI0013EAED1E|nr:GNAT family N-acetyltransferase [Litoribacterium kuwaitense]NGP44811.1 GNAT family N-acetyltransferase [Litoribacterium kuwaitense]